MNKQTFSSYSSNTMSTAVKVDAFSRILNGDALVPQTTNQPPIQISNAQHMVAERHFFNPPI